VGGASPLICYACRRALVSNLVRLAARPAEVSSASRRASADRLVGGLRARERRVPPVPCWSSMCDGTAAIMTGSGGVAAPDPSCRLRIPTAGNSARETADLTQRALGQLGRSSVVRIRRELGLDLIEDASTFFLVKPGRTPCVAFTELLVPHIPWSHGRLVGAAFSSSFSSGWRWGRGRKRISALHRRT